MKDFLFTQEQARTPLEVLSGGERGRLMLARALAKPSNLLVLDEPTNDLDLETLDVLEEMLGDYDGTVLLISHDRDFLDRVVTSVIAPEGDGRWDRICRRLQRHAGAARRGPAARGAEVRPARQGRARGEAAAGARGAEAPAELQREACAGDLAERRWRRCRRRSPGTQARLADPSLYVRDRKAFDEISAALVDAQAKLHAAEEKWLALEILREELENG